MPNQFIIYLYLQSNNKKELHDLSENLFNYLPNWEDLAVDYRSNSVYLEYFYIPRFYGIEACQKIIKIFSSMYAEIWWWSDCDSPINRVFTKEIVKGKLSKYDETKPLISEWFLNENDSNAFHADFWNPLWIPYYLDNDEENEYFLSINGGELDIPTEKELAYDKIISDLIADEDYYINGSWTDPMTGDYYYNLLNRKNDTPFQEWCWFENDHRIVPVYEAILRDHLLIADPEVELFDIYKAIEDEEMDIIHFYSNLDTMYIFDPYHIDYGEDCCTYPGEHRERLWEHQAYFSSKDPTMIWFYAQGQEYIFPPDRDLEYISIEVELFDATE